MFSLFYVLLVVPSYFAVSYGIRRLPCYGDTSTTEWSDMGHGKPHNLNMFFTPSRPGSQRIQVSKNGVVLDPHYVFSDDIFTVRKVTEKDAGEFSFLLDGVLTDVLTLVVRDCTNKVEVEVVYGDTYNFSVRSGAYSLEFTPQWHSDEPAVLLWNRTGTLPQAAGGRRGNRKAAGERRGRLVDKENNKWMIERITHEHSGYYTFRDKKLDFLYRRQMIVKALHLYFDKFQGEEFEIRFEVDPNVLDMSYTPTGGWEVPLMKDGWLVDEWERVFDGRMSRHTTTRLLQVRIKDVQPSDAGHFEISDQQGRLALRVQLDVEGDDSYISHDSISITVAIAVVLHVSLVLVVVCACVWKYKKKSRQNNAIPLNELAAAEAVSLTDDTAQPSTSAHPSSSHGPTYPSAPLSPNEPGSSRHHPLGMYVPESSSHGPTPLYPKKPGPTDYQPLFQAPGPVQSSSASGLPVFIHPTTHF